MEILIIIIIGIIVYNMFKTNSNQSLESKSNFSPLAQATEQSHTDENSSKSEKIPPSALSSGNKCREIFEKETPDNRKRISDIKDLLMAIVINNVRWLPKDILKMEYTQKVIISFVMLASSPGQTLSSNKIHCHITAMGLALEELERLGVLDGTKDMNEISRDPVFIEMSQALRYFKDLPAEQITPILGLVEKYMEAKTGHRVRYKDQHPTDNPLNQKM